MKRVLLTGMAGKSGLAFAKLLAESTLPAEYTLRILVRTKEQMATLQAILPQAEYMLGDLEEPGHRDQMTRDVDILFHIAGIGKSPVLVKTAAKNGVKRMILVHTTGIYSKYKAAGEWLASGGLGALEQLKAETVHGESRFDFSFVKDGKKCFLEVKGVTLEQDGVCAFPDAPTQRGARHLRHLAQAAREGYGAFVLFVIQMADVAYLRPNDATDPDFGKALREAAAAGVQILAMDCCVSLERMELRSPVELRL